MKSKGLLIVATLAIIASAGFYLMRYTSIFKPETAAADDKNAVFSEQAVGYIHRSDSLGVTTPPLQHISIQLSPNTTEKALTAALKVPVTSENLLVTVVAGQEGALGKVTDGQFDDVLQTLCRLLPKTSHIYLRWDPDMEVPVQRYSWQYQAPVDYINAFRHVAKVCRSAMPSIQIMWSPAGYPGTEEYWPGADVVDAIGISVNGQSELAATAYPQEPDTQKLLRRKLIRTRFMNKPIWVVASGTDSTVQVLQNDLKAVVRDIKRDSVWLFQDFAIGTPEGRKPGAAPLLGVYDPKLALTGSKNVTVEHLFVDLENIQSGAFEKDFNAVLQRGHQAIVTVEPWRDGKVRKDSSVLMNTIAGVYDEEFKSLFQTISKTERPVYVRFAHEMEIPIHRYPWQSQEPVLYIRAFRHFMELGSWVKNMKRVWGPAGDRGSMEWYPGGDVVDMVSIAIYGLPDKNITDPNKQESFETIFNRKIWRMRFASKPMLITEFGVKGPEDYQSGWMEKAARVVAAHREVVGACYFNLADNPAVWGDIPAPDWGISHKTFSRFAEVLKNAQ
ncbi:beta-mannanase-like protein [Dyadobacter fermentans]|uniref:Beta-mannanase-like protein n=1 Tax=Dyadobacter fermentans (strain ATCC 700827 / DSM 18053 / CIP 107007 / KCTC 52180 / NS114) TaxID=471854 RepID=C6W6B8_DYAFD|nr:beta-mannanase-like protein [Dyadobacter fermentans]ACT94258.1 Beta-mannanase-like protein [Dyadobacter fermentans DSM 18053]